MQEDKRELALYVINLKIAKEFKENTEKDYARFREKIKKLKEEKEEIYKENNTIIEKVINEYLDEVKLEQN